MRPENRFALFRTHSRAAPGTVVKPGKSCANLNLVDSLCIAAILPAWGYPAGRLPLIEIVRQRLAPAERVNA